MIAEVAAAWGWDAADIAPIAGGLINETFAVRPGGEAIAVLQCVHPIFAGEVNLDIEAVTAHLAAKGMPTPRLIRTRGGDAWIVHGGRVWRALSWVNGLTVHAVPAPPWAEAGGALAGRFHRAVADLAWDYKFARAGVHDTAAHLARLAEHVAGGGEAEWRELGREIAGEAAGLPVLPLTARRHCHGDLKISNLLFGEGPTGVCLVDLDTLGRSTIAFELGDAMRSWCNPRGEDAAGIAFDVEIFAAAVRGFRAVADDLLTDDERVSIVIGAETVSLELAARFAVDVFRDEYFGWNAEKFASRRAHNLARARGQLQLARSMRAARAEAMEIVRG